MSQMKKMISLLVCALMIFSLAGCGERSGNRQNEDELISGYDTFDVTSENLHDGVWDDVISNTEHGSNLSPQLSWKSVDGANTYAIYMIDTTVGYFVHWISSDVTDTVLSTGWAPENEYIGPYPPKGGPHTYNVYVLALKNPVERLKGGVNTQTLKVREFIDAADTDINGNTGNILSIGRISGTYEDLG